MTYFLRSRGQKFAMHMKPKVLHTMWHSHEFIALKHNDEDKKIKYQSNYTEKITMSQPHIMEIMVSMSQLHTYPQ